METKKLYYADGFLGNFSGTVLSCEKIPEGYAVVLDQTAFFPGGGGQACDQGTLGDARVTGGREDGDTPVCICDRPLTPGSRVSGCIDWDRRFDQMQQHTGEHILSGIVFRKYGYHNVGFHVGGDTVTVDFDGIIPGCDLEGLEQAANQAVWEDIPLSVYTPERSALAALSYRTKRALPWPVRIVEIPGVDRCACCAVHVKSTGQVGQIKILSCVKFHSGVRMEIVCGNRALACFSRIYEQNRQVGQVFSAKPLETGEAARAFAARLEKEKFYAEGLLRRIFTEIAAKYAGKGDCHIYEPGLLPAQARTLCDLLAASCGGTAMVLTDRAGGCHVCIIGPDANRLGEALRTAFGGKGGGKPGFFQGSLDGEPGSILASGM